MKQPVKQRIDQLLVDRGLAESRQKAQALILAGSVLVNGQKAQKPGQAAPADSSLELLGTQRYVSRGGIKLEHALIQFHVDPNGKVCIDIGSSTGGFVDCLLQHGALRVHSVDVGPTQLHWKLQTDPHVVIHDHTNARYLDKVIISEPCAIAVCDVSFISVTHILPALTPLLTPDGEMIILIKPQFEAGREQVGKGGIVKDPEVHQAVCRKVTTSVEELGFRTQVIESPISGAEGNREFLLHAAR